MGSVLEFPGAPVGLDSKLYIERPPIETLAYEEITKPGSIIRIKAPWKMGKTSLLLRIINQAESYHYSTVNIDFQQAEKTIFSGVDKFFRWFSRNISWKLKIPPNLDNYWHKNMGSKVSCTIYFEAYLLQQIETNLVLGLNEVNRLFEYPDIAEEFFSLLRSWYEQARSNNTWKKLRLVLTYSTEIYIPLNINQSPFNVGLPLKLPAFDPEQVLSLALRHGLDWTPAQTKQLMAMVGGHPFLVRLGLYHLSRGELTLKQLLQEAVTETGIYSSILRRILAVLQADPQLEKAFKQVIYADQPIKLASVVTYKLDSMGIVTLKGDYVVYSCELYRLYFKNQLLE
ncbi:MAG: AAA-like domain-containing protein [Planktothrix sp. GU0601_MAG3]|nr:MAG: AAA-like domain-containing protein [Planktothrix sp. GU0601_MAG3]